MTISLFLLSVTLVWGSAETASTLQPCGEQSRIMPDESQAGWQKAYVRRVEIKEDDQDLTVSISSLYEHEGGGVVMTHQFFGHGVVKNWLCTTINGELGRDYMTALLKADGTWQVAYADFPLITYSFDSAGRVIELVLILKDKGGLTLAERVIKRPDFLMPKEAK